MTSEIFRQSYPNGGVVSELAAIEHGQYVVRVLLQNEGITLASGLAAASTVEQAEDQARLRAFGLLLPSALSTLKAVATPSSTPSLPSTQVTPQAIAPPVSPPAIPAPVSPAPVPPAPVPPPVASSTSYKFDLPLSAPPEPEPIIEEPPLVPTPSASPSVAATPIAEEALDFSEIIARSDVELKRLGWTSEQGRNYLLETYGKRSRQLLSDEELLEFLRHLEGQPTP